jgi:SAM-dependent methyltransferase
MTSPHDKAWNDFWAQNRNSGQSGGCLPEKWQGIDAVQKESWRKFAAELPRKARVLDVATGDGRVMAWLLAKRRDLKLTGVDMASVLPEPPRGTKMQAGVLMEDMPFPNKRFAAATSQFGFEYGSVAETAAELARIVEPGGRIGLMTHRQDGPILEHNLKRRKQIGWAIDEQQLIELAKKSLALRASGLQTMPPKLAAAPAEGARLFGARSAAWEIPEAIRQTLVMGARDHPANVAQLLDTIAAHARNEIGRINSLEAACAQTTNDTAFIGAIEQGGLSQRSIDPVLEEASSRPFADFRILTHS